MDIGSRMKDTIIENMTKEDKTCIEGEGAEDCKSGGKGIELRGSCNSQKEDGR